MIPVPKPAEPLEANRKLYDERDALRAALEDIANYEHVDPPYPSEKIKEHAAGCDECKAWEKRNHPIQGNLCDRGHDFRYRWESDCKHAQSLTKYHMKDMARAALAKNFT